MLRTDWLYSGKNRILDAFQREKRQLLLCVAAVFLWGLLAHGYGFLHCSPSHDALNAFIASEAEELWKIRLGRFLVPYYRSFFRGSVALPWLIGILGLFWTAIAVYLVCRLFRVKAPVCIVLISGIMSTNLSYISQLATYYYEFDFNAFSMLMAVLAAYLWERDRGVLSWILGSIFLFLSIGIYQAYISVTLTLIISISLRDLLDRKTAKEVFLHGLKGIALLVLSGGLYLLAQKGIFAYTGLRPEERTDLLSNENTLNAYLNQVKPALVYLTKVLNHPAYQSRRLGLAVQGLTVGLGLTAAVQFLREKNGLVRSLLALALLLVLPLAMVSIYFPSHESGIHELMIYAVWLFYIFLLLLSFRLVLFRSTPWTRLLRAACCLLVGWLLWQNVVIANTAYVRKEMEAQADLSTMTRVTAALEQRDDYDYGVTPIAFIGARKNPEEWYGAEGLSKITGLQIRSSIFTDSYTEYFNTYKAYFRFILQYDVNYCDMETHERLKKDPRVERMPAFPEKGYMEMLDGVLVVKMAP